MSPLPRLSTGVQGRAGDRLGTGCSPCSERGSPWEQHFLVLTGAVSRAVLPWRKACLEGLLLVT